jgi:hypothetical protein
VPRKPRTVTDCNCSICYWGPKSQHFVRCATCGCVMCWQKIPSTREPNMGVNARNFEPEVLRSIPVVPLDGASM